MKNYATTNIGFSSRADVNAEGRPIQAILQKLLLRPINRRSQDIGTMLANIRAAEADIPRYTYLFDMFHDFLSTDAHLRSVYDKRIMGVTNVEWIYADKDGKENPVMTAWIDTPDFELVVSEIIKSKAWFYTMLEFEFYPDGTFGVVLVPRKHMRPKQGMITYEQGGDTGIFIREGRFADTILEAGDENDLGLLTVAAQYVILKRCGLTDWAEFNEVFGRPIIDAVWDGFDEDQKQALIEALEAMGGGGQLVRPAGTTVEILQGGPNNPNGLLYKGIIDICNAEISKLFVGQTETTESSDSSGFAQAKVHAGTENDINANDINFVRRLLNRRVCKILEANGIIEPGGSFSVKDNSAQVSKTEQLNIDKTLKNDIGLPIDDDHFYKTYGIERPADYDAQKAAFAAKGQAPAMGGFNMALKQTLLELKDQGFFLKAPKANGAKTISLKEFYKFGCCAPRKPKGWVMLADGDLFNEGFLKDVFGGLIAAGQINQDYYFNVAQKLTDGIMKGLKFGTRFPDIGDNKTRLFENFRHNVYAFSAAKNMAVMREFNKALRDDKGNDRNYSEFRKAAIPIDQEFNDHHLKTEYNAVVAKTQMGDKFIQLQKYDMLEFRAVMDDKTRATHAALDGTRFPPDHPFWKKHWPPLDWGCRCTVIPAQGEQINNQEVAEAYSLSGAIKPYFKGNSAISGTVINEDEHPYFNKIANYRTGAAKSVELMAEENYAMPSVEKIVNRKGLPDLTLAQTKEQAAAAWAASDKKVNSVDGVSWNMSDNWNHVVDQHADERWKYINHAKEILEGADEVWVAKQGMPNGSVGTFKRYVKYYKGQPVVFSYPVDDPASWTVYAADVDSSGTYKRMRDIVRRGILVHRK